jgi:hypothetical protein
MMMLGDVWRDLAAIEEQRELDVRRWPIEFVIANQNLGRYRLCLCTLMRSMEEENLTN